MLPRYANEQDVEHRMQVASSRDQEDNANYKHYRLLSREKNVSAMKCRGNWLQYAYLSMESRQLQCAKILQG